jgi:polyphosphate kinase
MTRVKKELPKKTSELTEDVVIEVEATVELSETQNMTLKELHPLKQQQIIDQNAQAETQAETIEEPVDPALYFFNRELSWVAFNKRVLNEGIDPRTPLLERAKFCAIFSTNLDEFFMVRVAGVKKKFAQQTDIVTDDGLKPDKQLQAIRDALVPLVTMQHEFFENTLRSELHKNGVKLLDYKNIDKKHQHYLKTYFQEKLFPVLTPLAVDPAHPFPYISNLSLSLVVIVRDRLTGEQNFARVKVPSILPRFVKIPETDEHTFVPLEQVIAHNLEALFTGMEILNYYPFRITRDAELDIE